MNFVTGCKAENSLLNKPENFHCGETIKLHLSFIEVEKLFLYFECCCREQN